MIALNERERAEEEFELDLERALELENEESVVVEPETIPFLAISDWSAYEEAYP